MFELYGVEAGRMAIIKEIEAVFAVYNIEIDHRHLSLLADYMVGREEMERGVCMGVHLPGVLVVLHGLVPRPEPRHHEVEQQPLCAHEL